MRDDLQDADNLKESDIPQFARKCWQQYQTATSHIRQASEESTKFYIGGEHQWLEAEVAARRGMNRPMITADRCKPMVDQVESEAWHNPPGPDAYPIGGGADADRADIQEGLIREIEFRSYGLIAYIWALRNALTGNNGLFILDTEYVNDYSNEQQVVIKAAPDPSRFFFEPSAREFARQDANWQGELRILSREQVIAEYGKNLKILNSSSVFSASLGAVQDMFGWGGDESSINEWTGGYGRRGPYYLCNFYRKVYKRQESVLYSDNIWRFEDEDVPKGVNPKQNGRKDISRMTNRCTIKKHVVTALDHIETTVWLGKMIPYFWVMGPEIYLKGKLHRHSLISGCIPIQRALNYAMTTAAEIIGVMSKAPYIGAKGAFDVVNAQGINPWLSSNRELFAYLEYNGTFTIDPVTQQAKPNPPPSRNLWEAPVERAMAFATQCAEFIKASAGIFFDPTAQSAAAAQSGKAIEALQAQSNVGTSNWQIMLHNSVALQYNEIITVNQQILKGQRVKAIIRPNSQHEMLEINKEFPDSSGKTNSIEGVYAVRVTAGRGSIDDADEATAMMLDLFKIAPQLLAAPGVAATLVRLVGRGNPIIGQLADNLPGGQQPGAGVTLESLQNQLQISSQQMQQLTAIVQKQGAIIQQKQIEADTKLKVAAIQATAGVEEARIAAKADDGQATLEFVEGMIGQAHDAATQAVDHAHEAGMQSQQLAAQQQQAETAAQQPQGEQ